MRALLAQSFGQVINSVGGLLPPLFTGPNFCTFGGGACGFVDMAINVTIRLRPLIIIAAVFVITIAGFRLVITETEETLSKAKQIIGATLAGVILSYLVEPFVDAFYGGLLGGTLGGVFGGEAGSVPRGEMLLGAMILSTEVSGVIRWFLVITATLAVLMIVIAGLQAVGKSASEEGVSQLRRTVFYVIAGILILVFSQAITQTFGLTGVTLPGAPTIGPAASAVITVVSFVLGFLALVAVAVIVYAGFLMVANLGNEEQFGRAKSLLIRVAIGLFVIIVSLALVNFVIGAAFGTVS
jgi:lysylphosphatidylglycerol synthetase-like protein (DUF2156 family)